MRRLARWLSAGVLLSATFQVSAVPADEITIEATRDNTLFFDAEGAISNGSGPSIFVGNNSQSNTRRGVLFFDLSGLSPDISVEEVELQLTVTNAPDESVVAITLHRLHADWGEGGSSSGGGSGAPSESGDATWIHRFYPDSLWGTPGGDFESVASATADVGMEGEFVWSGDGMVADVEGWLLGSAENHGWLLAGVESAPSTARRFGSRESVSSGERPVLRIRFTPLSPVRESSWGRIKAEWSGEDPLVIPLGGESSPD